MMNFACNLFMSVSMEKIITAHKNKIGRKEIGRTIVGLKRFSDILLPFLTMLGAIVATGDIVNSHASRLRDSCTGAVIVMTTTSAVTSTCPGMRCDADREVKTVSSRYSELRARIRRVMLWSL